MCRLAAYLGPEIFISSLVTEPQHSLIHQSFHAKEIEEPLNGDGFGLAWYAHHARQEPAIFKEITPAWNNQNLLDVTRVTKSSCIFAHVRAATVGGQVSRSNCHPFRWKNYTFMHNGTVAGFQKIQRPLRRMLSDEIYDQINGYTDSEHIFALFAENMLKAKDHSDENIKNSLLASIQTIEELKSQYGIKEGSTMNLVVTNGISLTATRYASKNQKHHSLYYLENRCLDDVLTEQGCEDMGETALLMASEPLGHGPNWKEIPHNHLLQSNRESHVQLVKI